jgi:peptidoglycan/xylan/chitin deacetylase (PgdA/CDA1 family)
MSGRSGMSDRGGVGGSRDGVGGRGGRGAAAWPRLVAAAISRVAGGAVVTTVDTDRPLVALTVDDGPDPATTPALLDALADAGATATFFLVGERARARPELVAAIAAAGHELGNHLWRDEVSVRLPAAEFAGQLRRTHDVLAAHGPVRWFRPGSGWFTPRMLRAGAALGYRCALGSPGLAVSQYPRPAELGARLAARSGWGDVVVLHEGTPARAAVPRVAAALAARLAADGVRAVSLTTLAP